jgi:RNA polymerase sigma-70 factor (ECF subfamily)
VTVTDQALVELAKAGDAEAFERLVDRHYARCLRYARNLLRDHRDAEEAVQDTFVRAYRALRGYEERERFEGWLYRILVNRCRTAASRAQRDHSRVVLDSTAIALVPAAVMERDPALREEIDRALGRLSPDQREAFLLRHVEDLSYEEMAAVTGDGVSALKMRVKRACDRLRGLLGEVRCA